VPDIDPDKHKLLIHGLVERPLIFTAETLMRYPMESRLYFIECAGNGAPLYAKSRSRRCPAHPGSDQLR